MPIKILMPALSPTMLEGNLIKWLKKENDYVKPGEVLAEIETDKATMEIEAVDEGTLGKIIITEGSQRVPVNSVIAILLEEGETTDDISKMMNTTTNTYSTDIVSSDNINSTQRKNDSVNTTQSTLNEIAKATSNEHNSARIFASPIAKKIAETKNIDIAKIAGSGPQGRIIKADVLGIRVDSDRLATPTNINQANSANVYKNTSTNSENYYLVPHNNIRKIIAQRLQESTQTIPHFYLSIECNIDKLLYSREDINKNFESKEESISINDFIVFAVAKSLIDVKEVNASWEESNIKYYNNVDISIAVATDHGLVTPIVKNAEQKNIIVISKEIKELAAKAKANKLRLDEFQGGGFSISNLGMYGVKNFSAIINPPQSCILAVGVGYKRPIVIDDKISIANIMDVTLSCDHRVVDGVVGALFLNTFKKYIENPFLMFI